MTGPQHLNAQAVLLLDMKEKVSCCCHIKVEGENGSLRIRNRVLVVPYYIHRRHAAESASRKYPSGSSERSKIHFGFVCMVWVALPVSQPLNPKMHTHQIPEGPHILPPRPQQRLCFI